jgi:esterase/lipase superfamily enzyme
MYQQKDLSDPDAEIDHVILAAPDVGLNEFDEKFKDELTAMSRNLTVYVSSNDDALLLSSLVSGKRRLGRQDFKYDDQGPEAKDMLYLKSLKPEKITLIDVTPINRSSYRHGYYLEAPEFYDDFYLRVFDSKPSANRHLYLLKYKDNIDYWVMQSEGSK